MKRSVTIKKRRWRMKVERALRGIDDRQIAAIQLVVEGILEGAGIIPHAEIKLVLTGHEKGSPNRKVFAIRNPLDAGIGFLIIVQPKGMDNSTCFRGRLFKPSNMTLEEFQRKLQTQTSVGKASMSLGEKVEILRELTGGRPFSTAVITDKVAASMEYQNRDVAVVSLIPMVKVGLLLKLEGKGRYGFPPETEFVVASEKDPQRQGFLTVEDFYEQLSEDQRAAIPLLCDPVCREKVTGNGEFRFPGEFPLDSDARSGLIQIGLQIHLFESVGENPNGVDSGVWKIDPRIYKEVMEVHERHCPVVPPPASSSTVGSKESTAEKPPLRSEQPSAVVKVDITALRVEIKRLESEKAGLEEKQREIYDSGNEAIERRGAISKEQQKLREQIVVLVEEDEKLKSRISCLEEEIQSLGDGVFRFKARIDEVKRQIDGYLDIQGGAIFDLIQELADIAGYTPGEILERLKERATS
ncbi:hypothetical protein A2438_07245 [candidate division WOR-1 bacterium RIFOXYC2_FULL_46_14]|uniref:Uncharacterized protein n=1 Tax=candidate division WOR-1 bacterium RIFOXYC2_FULL_46_14 TaxID=1802587 RepID=A0A1F4U3X5_UNCSA|nr:MAG: hypothetical protein A2438_07245 [candidate division WOR-1 bacterium RIFOXYC2_FULL_46_14]